MLPIDLHPSASPESVRREIAASIRANRLDAKGLYLTPRQAELWRQVSLRHSPVHTRPDFRRIYEEAFAKVAARLQPAPSLELVALGSGAGEKEARLFTHLQRADRPIHFTVVDVAEALVRESAQRLVAAGAQHRRSVVCDLQQIDFLTPWLKKHAGSAPRVITFFGLVPNFAPSQLAPLLRALLRPQDLLLASVHLVPDPGKEPAEILSAMRAILPQYDNPETHAWLTAALEAWDLQSRVTSPVMVIADVEGIPAFLALAPWKSGPINATDNSLPANPNAPSSPLELFQSLRYTPALFEAFLARESLRSDQLAITRCGEEGIWAIWR